jgi:hypothetical protein
VRVGPFAHGECRNGGLPDWLYGRPFALRSNDAGYLRYVQRLYGEIGRQLRGQFYQDGGPIIAVQLENEYMHASAPWEVVARQSHERVTSGADGTEHMRVLKELARQADLNAPFYTSTGWGGALGRRATHRPRAHKRVSVSELSRERRALRRLRPAVSAGGVPLRLLRDGRRYADLVSVSLYCAASQR